MTLSEAMRKGAAIRPQCFGFVFDEGGGSCAIGAAFEALGFRQVYTFIFPQLQDSASACPECGSYDFAVEPDVKALIVHLNDNHRWTREAIADWIDSLAVSAKAA